MKGYREIPENKILKFPATPGFKGWKAFFTDESTTHPAKMNLRLLSWIIETYTSPRDLILDPMAGTGSTAILAALMGRHAITVEYEPKFCEMIRENIKLTERQTTLTPKGRMICIQGDARELSKLLEESYAIITSPPYGAGPFDHAGGHGGAYAGGIADRDSKLKPFVMGKENIGNLPHGDIEAIITSPPYGSDNANLRERKDKSAQSILSTTGVRAVPLEEDNIGVLEYGNVDAVITSPPYEASVSDGREGPLVGGDERKYGRWVKGTARKQSYTQHLEPVDAVVTSPPYEASVKRGDEGPTASGKDSPTYDERLEQPKIYSNDPENIGNLKSESYLEAMLQVYRECYKVLKNKGVMVLVTKNFIRDKKVVRLDLDTIKLCEAAEFTLRNRYYFKLPTKSFWRILYRRKYPDVPRLEYEDVLVFEKEARAR